MIRRLSQLSSSIIIAIALVATAPPVLHAQDSSPPTLPMLSPEQQEAVRETLRPWVYWFDAACSHASFGPAMSVFFFMMILTFVKRRK